METKKYVLVIVILFTCLLAFGLPYVIMRSSNQVYYDPNLKIATQEASATATSSTERALTIDAFATLFLTPAVSHTPTVTMPPSPTLTFTQSPTITSTSTTTATNTSIPPTFTNRPGSKPTLPFPTNTSSGNPSSTSQAPTNPPPNATPTSPPVEPSPTDPPIIPPVISTLIPVFP